MFISKKKLKQIEDTIENLNASIETIISHSLNPKMDMVMEWSDSVNKDIAEIRDHIALLENNNSDLRNTVESHTESIEKILEDMEGYKNYKTEKDLLKESDEPWADFETTVDENGRVAVTMDWNKPFIEMLKKQGIKANNEEDMVSVYFSSLVREAGEELTEEQVSQLGRDG